MLISKHINVKHRVIGLETHVLKPAPLFEATKENFAFCDHPTTGKRTVRPLEYLDKKFGEVKPLDQKIVLEKISKSNAGVIICPDGAFYREIEGKLLIVVDNPRYVFAELVSSLFVHLPEILIHPTVLIEPDTHISFNTYIGPYTYIGKNCSVGANSIIHGHVHIHPNTHIGNHVVIEAGAVIGSTGFGYRRMNSGELENFPQIGGVLIDDSVEIGANTCIDRGTLGNTVIGAGTKIDNLVHIAHNVKIGECCVIVANSMIGGSVEIGNGCWVAPSASIINQGKIGKESIVGMGSVVIWDVLPNDMVKGVPAR